MSLKIWWDTRTPQLGGWVVEDDDENRTHVGEAIVIEGPCRMAIPGDGQSNSMGLPYPRGMVVVEGGRLVGNRIEVKK